MVQQRGHWLTKVQKGKLHRIQCKIWPEALGVVWDGFGMRLPSLAVQYGMDLIVPRSWWWRENRILCRRILTPVDGYRSTDRYSHSGIQLYLLPSSYNEWYLCLLNISLAGPLMCSFRHAWSWPKFLFVSPSLILTSVCSSGDNAGSQGHGLASGHMVLWISRQEALLQRVLGVDYVCASALA